MPRIADVVENNTDDDKVENIESKEDQPSGSNQKIRRLSKDLSNFWLKSVNRSSSHEDNSSDRSSSSDSLSSDNKLGSNFSDDKSMIDDLEDPLIIF